MIDQLFVIVTFFLCISHSLHIHRTYLANCDVTRLSHNNKFDYLSCRNVLYLPSPITQSLTFADNLDDDHFCSLLADKGFIVNYIDKVHEKWHANKFYVALKETVKHLYASNTDIIHPIILISTEISVLQILKYLQNLKKSSPISVGLVLVDPPPLHALLTEDDRLRILEERFFSLSKVPSIQPKAPLDIAMKHSKRRSKKKNKHEDTRPTSTHPYREISEALRSGKLGSADLFGEDLPSLATITQSMQPDCIQIISTDDTDTKSVSESMSSNHCIYRDNTHIGDTEAQLREPEDYWGLAAASELAGLCSTLPVLCLPTAEVVSLSLPLTADCWTEAAVAMHRDIAETVNQLMRNISLKTVI